MQVSQKIKIVLSVHYIMAVTTVSPSWVYQITLLKGHSYSMSVYYLNTQKGSHVDFEGSKVKMQDLSTVLEKG